MDRSPDNEAKRSYFFFTQCAIAANYTLTRFQNELLPDTIDLFSIEFYLSQIICIERNVLNLVGCRVMADANHRYVFFFGNLKTALKLGSLLHLTKCTLQLILCPRLIFILETQLNRADTIEHATRYAFNTA